MKLISKFEQTSMFNHCRLLKALQVKVGVEKVVMFMKAVKGCADFHDFQVAHFL